MDHIDPIFDGDEQTRAKLNQVITAVNGLDLKADKLDVMALPLPMPVQHRPGDSPFDFTRSLASGEASGLLPLPLGLLRDDENGRAVRLTGADVVAPRHSYALEPGRRYRVTFVVQRRVNSIDPSNDAIRCAIAWYGQGKGRLSSPAQTVVQDLTTLTTGSGRTVVAATVSRAAGAGIDIVSPAGARYCRPYVQTYGTQVQSDVETIGWLDITDVQAFAPDVSAVEARVSALESLDVGDRLTAAEAQLTAPSAFRVKVVGDLPAADLPVSVDVVDVLGWSDPGDGGGGPWVRSGTEPAHLLKRQNTDGTWLGLAAASPNPLQAGASPGALAAANSTAFVALESYAPARVIDLQGLVYPVTAKPTGATYINGTFNVGGVMHVMSRHPQDHPFAGAQPSVLIDNNRLHYFAGPLLIGPDGEIFGSWVEGIAHESDIDNGSTLATSRVDAAQINGGSLSRIVPVFGRNDRLIQHTQGGVLPSGRVLFVHSCTDATQAQPLLHPKTHATWSDDFFAAQPTLQHVDVSRTYPWDLGYGPMVLSGGSAHFFGYRKIGGDSQIVKLSTPDGESYTDAVVLTIPGNYAEAWVEPIGGGWFAMFVRNDAGPGAEAIAALSNDPNLVTWSTPVGSGLLIGANPIEAIFEGGNLTVYAFARRGLPIQGVTDAKVFWTVGAAELRAGGGVVPAARRRARIASSGATHMIGYSYYAQAADGFRLSLCMEGEAPVGSNKAAGSRLVYTTTAKTAVASPNLALSARPAESLTRNLHCIATRATSWPSITTDTAIIDGWRLDPNGGNVAVSVYDLPEQLSRAMPDSPSRMLQINTTAGPAADVRIYQRHYGAEAIRRISSCNFAMSTWTYGDFNAPLEGFASVYTGTGGSGGYVGSPTATLRGLPLAQGLTYLAGVIVMPSLVGVTLGPGCYVEISLRASANVAFNAFLRPPKFEVGGPTPYVYGRRDEPEYNAQWLTRLSFPQFSMLGMVRENASPTPDGPLVFGRTMIDRPVITVSSQTALEVAGIGVTAIAADYASRTHCRLKTTLVLPLDTGVVGNVVAVQPINFLLDCE